MFGVTFCLQQVGTGVSARTLEPEAADIWDLGQFLVLDVGEPSRGKLGDVGCLLRSA